MPTKNIIEAYELANQYARDYSSKNAYHIPNSTAEEFGACMDAIILAIAKAYVEGYYLGAKDAKSRK